LKARTRKRAFTRLRVRATKARTRKRAFFGRSRATTAISVQNEHTHQEFTVNAKHQPLARLTLETLEERRVPATISKPDANGTIFVTGNNTSETIKMSQDASKIYVNGKSMSSSGVTGVVFDMKGGNDTIDARGLKVPTIMYGGSGHDIMFGGSSTDRMYGDGDNDRLFGGGGYDYLTGGSGRDFLDDGNRNGHEWYADESGDGAFDFVADVVTPAGGAKPFHVNQGSGSYTCAFLAALGTAAQSGVNINDYISYAGHDNRGFGLYDVKLFNGQQWKSYRIEFVGHTYTQDAQPTVDYASWTILMNRAWIAMHGNSGAGADEGLKALGFKTQKYSLQSDNEFATIANHVAAGGMAVAVTKSSVGTNTLSKSHAYQVVQAGYVNGVAMVQVRNPWGIDISHTHTFDGVNDGYFWLTWATFKANMTSVALGGK